MNKEKTLTVTLDKAKEWYNKGGGLKELALQCFNESELTGKFKEKKFPKTWNHCVRMYNKKREHYEHINEISLIVDIPCLSVEPKSGNANLLPKGLGKPMLAFCQLLICREVYRDGWKPNWEKYDIKYAIKYSNNNIIKCERVGTSCPLSFQSKEACNAFLENFKDLIEEAKEFI